MPLTRIILFVLCATSALSLPAPELAAQKPLIPQATSAPGLAPSAAPVDQPVETVGSSTEDPAWWDDSDETSQVLTIFPPVPPRGPGLSKLPVCREARLRRRSEPIQSECISKCGNALPGCYTQCMGIPNPSWSAAEATNACVSQCAVSLTGLAYVDCREKCIMDIFLAKASETTAAVETETTTPVETPVETPLETPSMIIAVESRTATHESGHVESATAASNATSIHIVDCEADASNGTTCSSRTAPSAAASSGLRIYGPGIISPGHTSTPSHTNTIDTSATSAAVHSIDFAIRFVGTAMVLANAVICVALMMLSG